MATSSAHLPTQNTIENIREAQRREVEKAREAIVERAKLVLALFKD